MPTVYFLDLHKKIVGLDDIKTWLVPKQVPPVVESESSQSSSSESAEATNSFDRIEPDYVSEEEEESISEDSLSF